MPSEIDSIGSCKGILKKRNLWWSKGKDHEQHANQTDCGKRKPWMLALQPIVFECPPFKKKDQGCGNVKDGDVDPIRGSAKHSVIGVKHYRD